MANSMIYEPGDNVYCPGLGGEIYEVSRTAKDNVLMVNDGFGNVCKFLNDGKSFGKPVVWHATVKHYFALTTLFIDIEFTPVLPATAQKLEKNGQMAVKPRLPDGIRVNGLYRPVFVGHTPQETLDIVLQGQLPGETLDQTYDRLKENSYD